MVITYNVRTSLEDFLYSSTDINEAKQYIENADKNQVYYITQIECDLDYVAKKAWNKLNSLEKLALERTSCCIWKEEPQSKHSV